MNENQLLNEFQSVVQAYQYQPDISEVGTVISVGDGIALVSGLRKAMSQELLLFPQNIYGLVSTLDTDSISCILLGPEEKIKAGDRVYKTNNILEVPVGKALLGRVVNALGQPLDDKGPLLTTQLRPVESEAPALVDRVVVTDPLETGIKIIDLLLPLGKGQRELIIGDRKTGKTAIAVDMVLNQKDKHVISIYTFIGQKMSNIAKIIETFQEHDVLKNTIIIVASADDPPGMLYLAPYTASAMAEEFTYEGKDVLVVFDDLTKHAIAYRELSLLLHQPPGREAYPGDIFYLHSRLLERAAKLGKDLGGGSLSMIPIVETKAGHIASYIPTNLISITDGQIYLNTDLFNAGFMPAIDIGVSVSRVGSQAQTSAMRQISKHLKLDLAQYEELKIFSQFSEDLDKNTLSKIKRGERLKELLKQDQAILMPSEQQILVMMAIQFGLFDDVPLEKIKSLEARLIQFVLDQHSYILNELAQKQHIDEPLNHTIQKIIENFAIIPAPLD